MYNMVPRDYGAQVREGYSEWANGWTGDAEAKTVIPYEGTASDDSLDKLWVANRQGIWNVSTISETAPVQDVAFPDNGTGAGICSFIQYVTDADGAWLLLCDERNGYYVYRESTNTWSKPVQGVGGTDIANVNPALLAYVVVWKERVWFVERDTGFAWYLANGAVYGAATRFNFGRNFKAGGELRAIFNWSLDGGEGIDDYLVAVSAAGDVVIFKGSDPEQQTFGMVGVWNIGKVPAGRRIGTDFGGEVYLLSIQGLFPLSQVFQGSATQDPQLYLTYKVSPFLRDIMATSIDDFGWNVYARPADGGLAIATPTVIGLSTVQFLFDYGTQAWGISRGINQAHAMNWQGKLYFTDTETNKLWYENGVNVDKVHIDPTADGVAQTIAFSILTAYQGYGSSAVYKRMQFLRPMWLGGGIPVFDIQARYDFDVGEVLTTPPIAGSATSGIWNNAASTWDLAVWGGSLRASDNPRGANGMGRHIAVAMRGLSAESVTLVGIDAIWDTGGVM